MSNAWSQEDPLFGGQSSIDFLFIEIPLIVHTHPTPAPILRPLTWSLLLPLDLIKLK